MKKVTNFSEHPIMVQDLGSERKSMMGFRFFVSMRDHMATGKVCQ